MNKLLFASAFLLSTLLASCTSNKYPSFSEAKKACEKWEENRIEIRSIWGGRKGTFPSKYCVNEKETRQILGWEFVGAKEGKLYSPIERAKLGEKESVTKRFYY